MTNKKAIDRFKDEIAGQGFYNDNEHREFAIKALEKQIPGKPVIINHHSKYFAPYTACPVCNYNVVSSDKYCPECGQSLDWSEE